MRKRYNHIICNPPYFEDSLKSPSSGRTTARHTDSLSFEELFEGVERLLADDGRFSLIVPDRVLEKVLWLGQSSGMFLTRHTKVFSTIISEQPKRHLLEFSKKQRALCSDSLTIETARHCYTEEYKVLTKDFYLDR